jgi:hypothetical protein
MISVQKTELTRSMCKSSSSVKFAALTRFSLRLQMASGLAAVRSYEAERQRIDELAALDRAKVSQ